jgi:hypothetical protein
MKIICNITKQDVIETNQRVINLCLDELDVFCVRQDALDEVFKIFDNVDTTDDLQGLIKKDLISWHLLPGLNLSVQAIKELPV